MRICKKLSVFVVEAISSHARAYSKAHQITNVNEKFVLCACRLVKF